MNSAVSCWAGSSVVGGFAVPKSLCNLELGLLEDPAGMVSVGDVVACSCVEVGAGACFSVANASHAVAGSDWPWKRVQGLEWLCVDCLLV